MLPGSQRQRGHTKEETPSQLFGSTQTKPNHGAVPATRAGISDLVSQSNCQHSRELLGTALEHGEPGHRRESHSWGTVPSSVGAAAGSGGQSLCWAAPKPHVGGSRA